MSQNHEILALLKTGESITPMDALKKFGCFRLAARIYEIRAMGYVIESKPETDGKKTYSRYYMPEARQ